MLFPQPKVTTLLHVSLACLLLSQLTSNHARSLEEWRTRSIYQIVTDRFATSGPPPLYCDLTTYCGGSFTGIIQKLGYIKRLGFDAIWISPVVTNMDRKLIETPDASTWKAMIVHSAAFHLMLQFSATASGMG